ncbi:four helix bundle protein [Deinococcus soli (ex Cha et al. 2016)]|uniref:Four helix bundle protein n=2 Tax=Deinococcus soli (ex Cha et al. 2016) TaxID=1309411 RepID=A0AAE3X8I7_9DEIO|nr:four helix bundle protein [Deinococcus soli (ex Cha et al. 2016)]MDR6217020.1 four helix bundle protein [Deinococcus soli (ex Cha et al. 2016)]MDR6327841.1 four helix bundle protein [Deinococcus soli (ex Cha et al. 2016)]MDR6750116.1 four helix bundle protein [Deinococcus soli (ex Cha et al. 2016)]
MTGASGPGRIQTLEVWQDGLKLAEDVYRCTARWPADERYGLISQARRAAASIPTNLSEGVGRGSPAEIARFGRIALGSAYELHTLLHLAHRLHDAGPAPDDAIFTTLDSLTRRIASYVAYQDARHQRTKGQPK